jgi:hypothetical protein
MFVKSFKQSCDCSMVQCTLSRCAQFNITNVFFDFTTIIIKYPDVKVDISRHIKTYYLFSCDFRAADFRESEENGSLHCDTHNR